MHYALLGRDIERDVIPMMRRYGLGLTVWSPLSGGFLSGKYTRETLSDRNSRISGCDFFPFDKEEGFKLVDHVRVIATRHQATLAHVALVWLLAKPAISSIILGATKRAQLDDNLGAAALRSAGRNSANWARRRAWRPFIPTGSSSISPTGSSRG